MRALVLLLACSPLAFAGPRRLALKVPPLQDEIEVAFPDEYDRARSWPAVFYYHGTNGSPATTLIRRHGAERGWFVVGMAYVQKGAFTYSVDALKQELTVLRSARRRLAETYNLDPSRTYVAGFSKGGWMAGFLLQADPELAGAVILGAGHLHQIRKQPRRFDSPKPVFIGIGRHDGNYPFSLRAVTFFRSLGATTTHETWPDLEHQFPPGGSPALRQWIAIQEDPAGEHADTASAWVANRTGEIEAMPDPVARWVALHDLKGTPYARLAGEDLQQELAKTLADLESSKPVATEARALAEHRKLLRRELGPHTLERCRSLRDAYLRLGETYPGTRQGKIALKDHERMVRLLKHFEEQDRIAREEQAAPPDPEPLEPEFPERRRNIPRNPLVR